MLILSVDQLRFAYDERPILDGVALSLAAGEVVSLLGPNGSGKSTLLRAMLGHLRGSGEIAWEGRPLKNWSTAELARRVAYLPQTPTVEPTQTVLDVLRAGRSPYQKLFGLESTRDLEIVEAVAERLGLREFLRRRLDELSGGQRQRVFIGRCLVQEPAAMLLDEPVTFLDLAHQRSLMTLLRELAGDGIAILMAIHEINLAARFSDRLIVLSAGRVVIEGSPDVALDAKKLSRGVRNGTAGNAG